MEEKEINSIAGAVTAAISKLNADTKEKEADDKQSDNKGEAETFKCPDCDGEVVGGIKYCQHCGCALEWEE